MGLQLSYFGTIGIIFFNNTMKEMLSNLKIMKNIRNIHLQKVTNSIIKMISVTLSAQIMILPITLYYFNIIGVYFLLTNILVSVIIGPIMFIAILFLIFTFINNPHLMKFISTILILGIKILIFISNISEFPLAKIYVKTPSKISILGYYISIIIIKKLYEIYSKKEINNTEKRMKNLISLGKYRFNEYKRKNRKTVKKIAKVAVIISIIAITINKINSNLKVYFVDVGQGDCSFIVTPQNKTILIDGGGSLYKKFDIGKNTLLPYILDRGFTKIDYMIISHFDQDHCGGLIYILNEIKVKNIIIGKQYENYPNYENFIKCATRQKIKVHIVEAGMKIKIENKVYIDVLWPDSKNMILENSINNNSLVCKLKHKEFSILFTGDIEKPAEEAILKKYKNFELESTVLKIAHHGSKTSSSIEFLDKVNPKYALIGVGKNNKFNHPSSQTITKLREKNIRIYRTDLNGETSIKTSGERNKIKLSIKINK